MWKLIAIGARVKRFIEELKDHKDAEVRCRAERILEAIPIRERLGDRLWEKFSDKLMEFVFADAYQRLEVLNDIASIKDKDKRPTEDELVILTEEILRVVQKREEKCYIINFIKDNNLKGAGKALVKLLRDKDRIVRKNALEVLDSFDAKEYAKDIVKLLEDEDWIIREEAIRVLGRFGAKECAKDIVKLFRHKDRDVRSLAILALGKVGAREHAKDLARLLKDSYVNVRLHAVKILGNLGAKEYIKDIIKLLRDEFPIVRVAAAEALGKLGAKEALKPLKRLLRKERYDEFRQKIKEAIEKIKSAEER
jgi:rRNA processing protein Krr1/Pno1